MALEKMAFDACLLSRVAQHYTGAPDAPVLTAETVGTIQALDKWMVGLSQSKYFGMALARAIKANMWTSEGYLWR